MKVNNLVGLIILAVIIIFASMSWYSESNDMNKIHYIGAGTWTEDNIHEGKWQYEVKGKVIQYSYTCLYSKRKKDYLEGKCTSSNDLGTVTTISICHLVDSDKTFKCENTIISGTGELENIVGVSFHTVDSNGVFYGTSVSSIVTYSELSEDE